MIRELDMQEAMEAVGGWGCTDTTNLVSSIIGGAVAGVTGVAAAAATKNPYVAYGVGGATGGAVYGGLNGLLNGWFC